MSVSINVEELMSKRVREFNSIYHKVDIHKDWLYKIGLTDEETNTLVNLLHDICKNMNIDLAELREKLRNG